MDHRKLLAALPLLALAAAPLEARVTRIEASPPTPVKPVEGQPTYEQLSGTFYGEIDPRDAANKIITDLDKAPRNRAGKVEYSATFSLQRPVDPAKGSGVLIYDVPNRGGSIPIYPDLDGHIRVTSGWQGDIAPAPGAHYAVVPVARERNGASITGPIMARLVNLPATARSAPIFGGLGRPTPLAAPVSLDAAKAQLVIQRVGKPDEAVSADAWSFADCRNVAFPGTPDPAQLCLKAPFEPDAAYLLTYQGKDPRVLGIGFAATRDLVSFLRSGQADPAGTPNPARGGVRWTVATGTSQAGNFLRSFVHLGFNADEGKARVFDGIHPHIAVRQVPLNMRFGLPGSSAQPFEAGSEAVLWWGNFDDRRRKRGKGSLLDRCTKAKTCPKVIETLGSGEFWTLRASASLQGTDAAVDIPLPGNVRRYYIPSVNHGGSWVGGFPAKGEAIPANCALPGNPASVAPVVRVAIRSLIDWVKDGKNPPANRYPTLANGDLVAANAAAMGWPAIPGAPRPDGKLNPLPDHDFGKTFNYRDASGIVTRQPPAVLGEIPLLVPKVNADGNETVGVPPIQLLVPTGTFTGWNVQTRGYGAGGGCGLAGGFIPFARTRAERLAKGDPRPSLQERYGTHQGFVSKVLAAIAQQQKDGWLLPDDAGKIYEQAENSDILK
jgi:hypothetical protein